MRALITAGGMPPGKTLLEAVLHEGIDLVIAADSGARALLEAGIGFHLAVGDFDSLEPELLESIRKDREVITYPPGKDFSDTEAALREAVRRGAQEVVILGATGRRLDHFLANLGVLALGIELGAAVSIKDDHNELFIITGSCVIEKREGTYLSFFPMGAEIPTVSIENVRYPLTDHHLTMDSTLTVSNEFSDGPARITVKNGMVLVVLSRD